MASPLRLILEVIIVGGVAAVGWFTPYRNLLEATVPGIAAPESRSDAPLVPKDLSFQPYQVQLRNAVEFPFPAADKTTTAVILPARTALWIREESAEGLVFFYQDRRVAVAPSLIVKAPAPRKL